MDCFSLWACSTLLEKIKENTKIRLPRGAASEEINDHSLSQSVLPHHLFLYFSLAEYMKTCFPLL